MDECFICQEGGRLYKICSCDVLVHRDCYVKLVNVPAHSTHCAVCKAKYDMDITTQPKLRWTSDFSKYILTFFAVTMCGDAAFVTALALSWIYSDMYAISLKFFLVTTLILLNSFVMYISFVHYKRTRHLCCCHCKDAIVHRVIHLPEPSVV